MKKFALGVEKAVGFVLLMCFLVVMAAVCIAVVWISFLIVTHILSIISPAGVTDLFCGSVNAPI